jgi:hypothetical protein
MNNDIEQLLGGLTPRGARAELRPQVLAAVTGQLQAERKSRRFRRSALAVATSIVLAVALNIGLSRAADRRMARLLGPPPRSCGDGRAAYAAYCEILQRLVAETQRNPRGSKTSNGRPGFRGAANAASDTSYLAVAAGSSCCPRCSATRSRYAEPDLSGSPLQAVFGPAFTLGHEPRESSLSARFTGLVGPAAERAA